MKDGSPTFKRPALIYLHIPSRGISNMLYLLYLDRSITSFT